jgi:hypothetical protein
VKLACRKHTNDLYREDATLWLLTPIIDICGFLPVLETAIQCHEDDEVTINIPDVRSPCIGVKRREFRIRNERTEHPRHKSQSVCALHVARVVAGKRREGSGCNRG